MSLNSKSAVPGDMDNCFDLLRLIAASIVMLSHSFRLYGIAKPLWLSFLTDGATGVMMFFAISGYLIMMSYDRCYKKTGCIVFWIKRMLRVYPALLTLYLVVGVFDIIQGVDILNRHSISILIHVIIHPNGDIFGVGVGNGVLWSLGVELIFYIFVPLLHRIYRNRSVVFWLVSIAVLWLFQLFDATLTQYISSTNLVFFLYEFMVGSFFYMKREKLLPIFANKRIALGLILGYTVLFEIYVLTDIIPKWGVSHPTFTGIWVLPITIIVAYSFGKVSFKYDISYGIYMWHTVIIQILQILLPTDIKYMFLVWPVTILIAFLSCILIEQPFMRMKNLLKKKILF